MTSDHRERLAARRRSRPDRSTSCAARRAARSPPWRRSRRRSPSPRGPSTSSAVSTGPELAHQRQTDHARRGFVGAEAHERVVALQAEHHADREPADADDHERQHAELVDLVDEAAQAPGRRRRRRARPRAPKQRDAAELGRRCAVAPSRARRIAADHQLASAAPARRPPSRQEARTRGSALVAQLARARPRRRRRRAGARPGRPCAWSSRCGARSGSWSMPRVAVHARRAAPRSRARRADRGPENGSSHSRTAGLRIIARASATRFTMPPESSPGQQRVHVVQADGLEVRVHLVGDRALGQARVLAQRQRHVVEDRHRVEQRAALEHHAELAPHAEAGRARAARVMSSPSTRMRRVAG